MERAWVWIVGESSRHKEMKLDDVKSLCKERDLVICKNGIMFDVDEFTFNPETESIKEYGFVVGHYETQPHFDLVPRGTTIENGRYVFPQTNNKDMVAVIFHCIDNWGKEYKYAKVCLADKVQECVSSVSSTEVLDHEVVRIIE